MSEAEAPGSAPAETSRGRPRIVFVSPMSLLDTSSGAAISMRAILETLGQGGFEAHAFTGALFDGTEEFPRQRVLGRSFDAEAMAGKAVRVESPGLVQELYVTRSSVGRRLAPEESRGLKRFLLNRVTRTAPEIAIGYGSSRFTSGLFREVRARCGRFVLYVANPDIANRELVAEGDTVLVPSEAQAARIGARLGLADLGIVPEVFRDPIAPGRVPDPEAAMAADPARAGRLGFVTLINPSPEKGAALVLKLASRALRERPGLTFLMVESRGRRADWEGQGADLPNVWWIPNRSDIEPVFRRTAVLLFPSIWDEPSGRSIAEAQLAGIPVIAADRGGIRAQLNGGGVLVAPHPPEGQGRNARGAAVPVPSDAEVDAWFAALTGLLDDPAAYAAARERALEAAAPFRHDRRAGEIVARFRALLQN